MKTISYCIGFTLNLGCAAIWMDGGQPIIAFLFLAFAGLSLAAALNVECNKR